MPRRSLNVYWSPSFEIVHDSASPGTTWVLSAGNVTSVSTTRRPTRLELRSVTWGGSRFTGSATSPTTRVPAGCAAAGDSPRPKASPTATRKAATRRVFMLTSVPRVGSTGDTIHRGPASHKPGSASNRLSELSGVAPPKARGRIERASHSAGERLWRERLLKERRGGLGRALRGARSARESGHVQHPQSRIPGQRLRGQRRPAEARHDDVREKHVNRTRMRGSDRERLGRISGVQHAIAAPRQDLRRELPHTLFVFHEQDRLPAPTHRSAVGLSFR